MDRDTKHEGKKIKLAKRDDPAATAAMVDATTRSTLGKIPLLTVNAGPRDGDQWIARLKEEMTALIEIPH